MSDNVHVFPAAPSQRRLWFLDKLLPGNAAYNNPLTLRWSGTLDVEALALALSLITERHESLRTHFSTVDGQPVQVVAESIELPLRFEAVPGEGAEQTQRLDERILAEIRAPFDLARGPLFRATIFELTPESGVLLLVLHHIISDGWSFAVLVHELQESYAAIVAGEAPDLPELPLQYVDFSVWQAEQLQEAAARESLGWWNQELAGLEDLALPTDFPRQALQKYEGDLCRFSLSAALVRDLKGLAARENATLFMVLLAAYEVLLFRYSGQTSFAVGSPVAGRDRPELAPLIGFFINTIALRANVSPDTSFLDLLRAVRRTSLDAQARAQVPFDQIVEGLRLPRDLSRTPVFQVMFNLHSPALPTPSLPGLEVALEDRHGKVAQYDLTLILSDHGDELEGALEFDTSLFRPSTVERMVQHFQVLLASLVRHPGRSVASLPMLLEAERHRLLTQWNLTEQAYPKTACVHQLFLDQARRFPHARALIAGDITLTYRELARRARAVASFLIARGVQPESRVAVLLDRSADLVACLLGVLQAGAAYVPLDSSYPQDRLRYMLEDSGATLVLSQTSLLGLIPSASCPVVAIDTESEVFDDAETPLPETPVSDRSLAYIMYTSGSTGRPKGVMIEHRSIVNFLLSMAERPGLHAGDMLLSVTSVSFDIFGLELFLPLSVGASLLLPPRHVVVDPSMMAALLARYPVTVMQATPSLWRMLVEYGDCLPPRLKCLCGGEAFPAPLAAALLKRCREVWNLYGPTETTIWSTCAQLEPGGQLTIGGPIANTRVYVLDPSGQPAPIGVPGELFIGGDGVARGYWKRPELTAERFVEDPFSPHPGARMYRTGDRVRWLEDGRIEFFGRLDSQIKMRGHRIELGEIEAALMENPALKAAAVILQRDARDEASLIAYVVPHRALGTTPQDIRATLRKRLPDVMVPSIVVLLDALPMTLNGKIDRKRLPEVDLAPPSWSASLMPRNPIETKLVNIWSSLLNTRYVGIHDDFFALGGHSLLAAKAIYRIRNTFGADVPLQAIFLSPTVAGMAERIEALSRLETRHSMQVPNPTLSREAALDPDIQVAEPAPARRPFRSVLLTGATGFVGAYLLSELLLQTGAQVVCLVHGPEPRQRIVANLVSYGLWRDEFAGRIELCEGDLGEPLLGLTSEAFALLAGRLDAIYHCGAKVDFARPYELLRPANIHGTQEIIRLAAAGRRKPLHFISTLTVVPSLMDKPTRWVSEDDPNELAPDSVLHGAYAQTKWVADQMARQARERGLEATIYRLAIVSGHSQTGVGRKNDFVHLLIRGCVLLKATPVLDSWINLTAVDEVGRATVALSLRPESAGKTYHLTSPTILSSDDFMGWMRRYGYKLRHLPYQDWYAELIRTIELDRPNDLLALLPYLPEGSSEVFRQAYYEDAHFRADSALTGAALSPYDDEMLRRWFDHLVRSGFLPPP